MTKTAIKQTIGRNVRAEMARAGRTQKDAATALGLESQSAMSDRINGKVDFSMTEILALAAWLDLPLRALLVGLPRLDSNQEPAGDGTAGYPADGYRSSLVLAA